MSGGYNSHSENPNWFFAVGGYSVWGKGRVTVTAAPDAARYDLAFTYRLCDRYNWDTGKSVKILGVTVTDTFMGEFHREGLAREYDYYGTALRRFQWKKGEAIPGVQLATPIPAPGGRT